MLEGMSLVTVSAIIQHLTLDLSCRSEDEERTHKIAKSLSGVVCHGDYLFVGSDEGPGFERLHSTGAGTYGERERFPLGNFFDLPGGREDEADVGATETARPGAFRYLNVEMP
jgi:hypothetical protein